MSRVNKNAFRPVLMLYSHGITLILRLLTGRNDFEISNNTILLSVVFTLIQLHFRSCCIQLKRWDRPQCCKWSLHKQFAILFS